MSSCDYQDKAGNTALIYACKEKSPMVVQILLEYGADPNIRNNLGETALMFSIKVGRTPYEPRNIRNIFNMLIDYGAKVNFETIYRDTVIDIAVNDVEGSLYVKRLEELKKQEDLEMAELKTRRFRKMAKQRLAVASGLHPRLGTNTPIADDLIEKIATNLTGRGKRSLSKRSSLSKCSKKHSRKKKSKKKSKSNK